MSLEYKVVSDTYIVQKVRTERFTKLQWSAEEKIFKNRPKHVQDFFKNRQVPFHLLSQVKFKRSLFGIFLHEYNKNEVQSYFLNENKLAMMDYDQKTYSDNKLKNFARNNDFVADMRLLLEKAVKEQEVIDFDFLYDNIYALRFCDSPLTFIDSELLKFHRLKVLILCGNWITDIPGKNLPRSLEYIELFTNQIEFVHNFAHKAPIKLIHIGFRRNWLTNDSRLHLLGKPDKFHYLQSLDLAENDIYDLEDVVGHLTELKQLMCLQLQGNPCSVIDCYKDEVLRHIPWLVQLDNTEILEKDRQIPEDIIHSFNAAIIFTCHRIMGIPKPPKEKGLEQLFYFSISMPLLEDVLDVNLRGSESNEEIPTPNQASPKKAKKATTSKTNSSKKSGGGVPYNARDEYADELRRRIVDTTFKTERFGWDKIMQLPEEALLIKSTERNFADIRDTFRSRVCVKLIYLVVQPPQKVKTAKKGKAAKGTKGKKDKSINKSEATDTSGRAFDVPPKEIIMKKITLAQFTCDLHSINWSDKSIDYFWADSSKFGSSSVEIEGSLRALVYAEGAKGKPKKGNKTASEDSSEHSTRAEKLPIPKVPTIQVGFGLKRTYYQT